MTSTRLNPEFSYSGLLKFVKYTTATSAYGSGRHYFYETPPAGYTLLSTLPLGVMVSGDASVAVSDRSSEMENGRVKTMLYLNFTNGRNIHMDYGILYIASEFA